MANKLQYEDGKWPNTVVSLESGEYDPYGAVPQVNAVIAIGAISFVIAEASETQNAVTD